MKGWQRGFSLSEVLISSAVVLVLSGVVLAFLGAGLRDRSNTETLIEVQEQAYSGMHFMTTLLAESDIHSVTISAPPAPGITLIAFLSADNAAGTLQFDAAPATLGHLVWQNYMVFYYTPAQQTIRLGVVPLVPPSAQPSPYRLTTFTPTATDRIVAGGVTSFSATAADGTTEPWQNPMTLTVQCSTPPSPNHAGLHATLTSSVVMGDGATTGQGAPLNDTIFNTVPVVPPLL